MQVHLPQDNLKALLPSFIFASAWMSADPYRAILS